MSLYNMLHGVTPATFFILPVLGKHPEQYPRFRDCFTGDDERPEYNGKILIYTRVGGGNRDDYADEIREIRESEGYITDYDDSYDSTFATFVFEVPEKFKSDVELAKQMKLLDTSQEYRDKLYSVFPKLKEKFDQIFAIEVKKD